MSDDSVTPRDALVRLGASSAEAVAQVLEMFAPGQIERHTVSVLPDAGTAFSNLPFGAVAASVSYVDGVSGANVFLMSPSGARTLAAAMGLPPPDEPVGEDGQPIELSDLEISAIAEAANQMMAATAAAIGMVLGQEIEISPPDTRVIDDTDTALDLFGTAPHVASTTFLIAGEAARLIQLVPSTFIVRMVRAMDEQLMDDPSLEGAGPQRSSDLGGPPESQAIGLQEALSDIRLRVWAELGRTQLSLGDALSLPLGAVVELDCAADAPVALFVNGLEFAQGHLLVTDDGEWAVRLESVRGPERPDTQLVSSAQPHIQGAVT